MYSANLFLPFALLGLVSASTLPVNNSLRVRDDYMRITFWQQGCGSDKDFKDYIYVNDDDYTGVYQKSGECSYPGGGRIWNSLEMVEDSGDTWAVDLYSDTECANKIQTYTEGGCFVTPEDIHLIAAKGYKK